MRNASKLIVAGIAALGIAGAVVAAERNGHVLKVALPDGSVEEIHYTGDVAPRVIVNPAGVAEVAYGAPTQVRADNPFADMDRMMAAMDAQADAMFAQAAAMAQAAPRIDATHPMLTANGSAAPAPQGSYHYSYVSTVGGAAGHCVQSYELTSYGDGKQQPKVVSQQSGDCKGVPALVPTAAPATPATPAKPLPTTTQAAPAGREVKVSKDAHVI